MVQYISNSDANALFDVTKLISVAGLTAFTAILFCLCENDLNAYLLVRRGFFSVYPAIKRYKTKNITNKIMAVFMILIVTLCGFLPTIFAYYFPVKNYIVNTAPLSSNNDRGDYLKLTKQLDASGIYVDNTNIGNTICEVICNSTGLCTTQTVQSGFLIDSTQTVLNKIPIEACMDNEQSWCSPSNSDQIHNLIILSGLQYQLNINGTWDNYSLTASVINATTVPASDLLNNGMHLYTGVNKFYETSTLTEEMYMMPGVSQLMAGLEMAIDYSALSYNYVTQEVVSVL